jgi:beta-lactamase class A
VFLIEVVQWLWPQGRFFPNQKINGVAVGMMSSDEASAQLRRHEGTVAMTLTDSSTGENISLSREEAGVSWDYNALARNASQHTWQQRALPFSYLFQPEVTKWKDSLSTAAEFESSTVSKAAKNAALNVKNGKIAVTKASVGYSFRPADLKNSLDVDATHATADLNLQQPTVTTSTAQKLASTVTKALEKGFTLKYGTTAVSLPQKKMLPLLKFEIADNESPALTVSIDQSKLSSVFATQSTVQSIAHDVAKEQGVSVADSVTLADVIDYSQTAWAIGEALENGDSQTSVVVRKTSVTKEKAEKRATLNTRLAALFDGAAYAVKAIDLQNSSVVANIDADKDFTAASTYKLFVAYAMLKAVEDGDTTWDSELNGTTLQTCLTKMIVESDNDCPKAWLKDEAHSYTSLTEQARSLGASDATNFEYLDMHTTAADLATFLTKLYRGNILSDASRTKLLDLMKRQKYRSGIPAGIGSAGTVADKVGFLNGLLHDAGIVSTQKGDYVMVIMTNGSSWNTIAAASAMIYDSI